MTLNEFRKQYPQYNDVPDMELADQLYNQYYQDIDKNTYYKQLFPKIAEQKIEELESKMIPEVDGFIDQMCATAKQYEPEIKKAADQAGKAADQIDFDAPSGLFDK